MTRVQLFAVARQLAGQAELQLPLADGATVADLRAALIAACPALAAVMSQLRFAVNAEYAGEATPIPQGAEVACIPPVSGG